MSYILEALKKSEQERNPDRVPDLSTHHQAVAREQSSRPSWLWPVIILLLINLSAIYWFVIRQPQSVPVQSQPSATVVTENDAASQVIEPTQANQPANATVPEQTVVESTTDNQSAAVAGNSDATDSAKEATASVSDSAVEPVRQSESASTAPNSQPEVIQPPQPVVIGPPKFANLPHISELSQSIQSQLPAISFTTHIFVKDGGSFVIINNRNLSNGMSIGNGVMIEKIVREGVIFSFRDRYFTLNSMESWEK